MPAVAIVPIVCAAPFVVAPIIVYAVLLLANGMPLVVATPTVSDAPFADVVPAKGPKVFVVSFVANIASTALVVEIEHQQAEKQQNNG